MIGKARHRAFFVTGTDTGVGKTVVSVLLVRALRNAGLTVLGMKPAASKARRACATRTRRRCARRRASRWSAN